MLDFTTKETSIPKSDTDHDTRDLDAYGRICRYESAFSRQLRMKMK